jgi:hypothetical protein
MTKAVVPSDGKDASVFVRPGEKLPERSLEKAGSYNPDILRQTGIIKMMDGPGTLCRTSREEMILEGLVEASISLGMKLPATLTLIQTVRGLSPGLDGLGRGEAVKCLMTSAGPTYYPGAPFGQDESPGILSRLFAFFAGKKVGEAK